MSRHAWIIPLSEVPGHLAVHQYILQQTDLSDQIQKFSGKTPAIAQVKLNCDFGKLKSSVLNGLALYGQYQFRYGKEMTSREGIYLSTSLTHNPHAYDKTSDDPHQATLGSSVLTFNSAAKYEGVSEIKFRNSYHDTFAFNEKTPLASFEELGSFFETFKRTLIRSRISTIVANKEETMKFGFNWHNDELVFINMRINIPVQTSPNYVVQILKEEEGESLQFDEFFMETGHAYVYDTHKFHRAVCKKIENFDRIHMICGVSPWFDFDESTQSWKSNEYYGKIHPFDMLREGLISPVFKN